MIDMLVFWMLMSTAEDLKVGCTESMVRIGLSQGTERDFA